MPSGAKDIGSKGLKHRQDYQSVEHAHINQVPANVLIDKFERNARFLQDALRSDTGAHQDLWRPNRARAQYNLLLCIDARPRAIRLGSEFCARADQFVGPRFRRLGYDDTCAERPEENGEVWALSDGCGEVSSCSGASYQPMW